VALYHGAVHRTEDTGDWPFAVVVCTRNRAPQVGRTLDRLAAQDVRGFEVVVVDQSAVEDPRLVRGAAAGELRLLRDDGRGLSRARNVAWRVVDAEWIVFVDDDCLTEPDWSMHLRKALDAHPEAAFLSGHVAEHDAPDASGLLVSTFPVERETVRSGAGVWPFDIGFGVCMAVRREWIVRLGGWDERLGAGTSPFPAGEDMDFNYRLLRSGGSAVAVPQVRVLHDQWRAPEEIVGLLRTYALGWAGFACKTLRQGDVRGGARMWAWAVYGILRMAGSAWRRRSRLRLRVAIALTRGHARGTFLALTRSWGPA
jgi:GT2 family glycosyltransferase